MKPTRIEALKPVFKRLLSSIIISVIIGAIVAFMFCPHCFIYGSPEGLPAVLRYYILTFFLIWEFTLYASKKLNEDIISKSLRYKEIVKRILYAAVIFIPISLIYVMLRFTVLATMPERWGPFDILISELIILIQFISSFLFLNWKTFYDSWEKKTKETELIQKQKLEYELKALKNQINPHFLFNSLNTLTNLVHKDSQLAEKFINQLANVYRYILEQKSNNLIRIEEELGILTSYQFLMNIRFGEKIKINIENNKLKEFNIAPLALQILIENAIKHNEFSIEEPLVINLYVQNDCLIVSNNLRTSKKMSPSFQIGLENIKQRYLLLANKEVRTRMSENSFFVEIPIIGEQ